MASTRSSAPSPLKSPLVVKKKSSWAQNLSNLEGSITVAGKTSALVSKSTIAKVLLAIAVHVKHLDAASADSNAFSGLESTVAVA